MTEATGKLAGWALRLSELEYDVVNRPGVNNQAADELCRMETKGTDDTELSDELPILTMKCEKEEEYSICFEFINVEKGVLLTKASPMDQATTPTIAEFLRAQDEDIYFQQLSKSVGTARPEFIVDRNGMFFRVAKLDGATHKLTPVSMRARFLRAHHYYMLAGNPGPL